MTLPSYTARNIRSNERLAIIRQSPTQYVPDFEVGGLVHQAFEVFDNALDEAALKGAEGVLSVTMCIDPDNRTYQLIIRDNGRGMPIPALVDMLTKPHTSGKYDSAAYGGESAGLFGVGLKAATGLAKRFRAITQRLPGSDPDDPSDAGAASLLIEEGQHAMEPLRDPTLTTGSGVTSIYEPDPTIFVAIEEFVQGGYVGLIERLKKYCFFRPYRISFAICPHAFPAAAWYADIAAALAAIDQCVADAEVVFTEALHDRELWIRHYWGVTRPWAFHHHFRKPVVEHRGLRDFIITLYTTKFEDTGARFGLVNNVPIDAADADHLRVVYWTLTELLAPKIADPKIRKFFEETYRLPIFVAVDVKFEGAKFRGTLKDNFRSPTFRELYQAELRAHFATPEGQLALAQLYDELKENIEQRYLQVTAGVKANQQAGRLFLNLNYDKNFTNCGTKDRSIAELFLVEGASAGGKAGRDAETAAMYQLGGKPLNPLDTAETITQARNAILGNKIYQDVFRILGYVPGKVNDINALNFRRCFIMTDADQCAYTK